MSLFWILRSKTSFCLPQMWCTAGMLLVKAELSLTSVKWLALFFLLKSSSFKHWMSLTMTNLQSLILEPLYYLNVDRVHISPCSLSTFQGYGLLRLDRAIPRHKHQSYAYHSYLWPKYKGKKPQSVNAW